MSREQDFSEQAVRARLQARREVERVSVAHQDDGEDWSLLTALFGGLAVALILNAFIGLMPG